MNDIIVAGIGFVGVMVGALLSGIFTVYSARKSFAATIKQLNQEISKQKREVERSAIDKANLERERYYTNWLQESQCYTLLGNEIAYLTQVSTPKWRDERRNIGVYTPITNSIESIVHGVELAPDLANLVGSLRCHIDWYNTALEKNESPDIVERLLSKINTCCRETHSELFVHIGECQQALRGYEAQEAKDEWARAQTVGSMSGSSNREV